MAICLSAGVNLAVGAPGYSACPHLQSRSTTHVVFNACSTVAPHQDVVINGKHIFLVPADERVFATGQMHHSLRPLAAT
jgi:hypothetical protein